MAWSDALVGECWVLLYGVGYLFCWLAWICLCTRQINKKWGKTSSPKSCTSNHHTYIHVFLLHDQPIPRSSLPGMLLGRSIYAATSELFIDSAGQTLLQIHQHYKTPNEGATCVRAVWERPRFTGKQDFRGSVLLRLLVLIVHSYIERTHSCSTKKPSLDRLSGFLPLVWVACTRTAEYITTCMCRTYTWRHIYIYIFTGDRS